MLNNEKDPQLSSPQVRNHSWLMFQHSLSTFCFSVVAGHESLVRHMLLEGEGQIAYPRPLLRMTRRRDLAPGALKVFLDPAADAGNGVVGEFV